MSRFPRACALKDYRYNVGSTLRYFGLALVGRFGITSRFTYVFPNCLFLTINPKRMVVVNERRA